MSKANWDILPQILDAVIVANLLGQDEQTIKRHFRNGDLPAFKLGKEWRIDKDVLNFYVTLQSVKNISGDEDYFKKQMVAYLEKRLEKCVISVKEMSEQNA